MQDKWVDFAVRIQSIAQAGLYYGANKYDLERYEELRTIAAEMLAVKTDLPVRVVRSFFCNEEGYQTPKIDTRGVLFEKGKILLVHEDTGAWALPGGWCDVDQTVSGNTEKEVLEESGFIAHARKIIAIQDWRKHNVVNSPFGIFKIFVLCDHEGGCFRENSETTEIGFFDKDHLPENLAVEKTTKEQILMCFDAYENPSFEVQFD